MKEELKQQLNYWKDTLADTGHMDIRIRAKRNITKILAKLKQLEDDN